GRLVLVEADDVDLALLAGVRDGAQDGGRVVGPEANETNILLVAQLGEDVGGHLFGLLAVGAVVIGANELVVPIFLAVGGILHHLAGKFVDHTAAALTGIQRVGLS